MMGPGAKLEMVNKFTRSAPVDVLGLAKALGIAVQEALLPEDIAGAIQPASRDKYIILVNSAHTETRKRFTVAHELGHYIFHERLIGQGIYDDAKYNNVHYKNPAIGPKEETEANLMAVEILMPEELIREQLDALIWEKRDMEDPEEQPDRLLPLLAERLGVSEKAMRVRLNISAEPGQEGAEGIGSPIVLTTEEQSG